MFCFTNAVVKKISSAAPVLLVATAIAGATYCFFNQRKADEKLAARCKQANEDYKAITFCVAILKNEQAKEEDVEAALEKTRKYCNGKAFLMNDVDTYVDSYADRYIPGHEEVLEFFEKHQELERLRSKREQKIWAKQEKLESEEKMYRMVEEAYATVSNKAPTDYLDLLFNVDGCCLRILRWEAKELEKYAQEIDAAIKKYAQEINAVIKERTIDVSRFEVFSMCGDLFLQYQDGQPPEKSQVEKMLFHLRDKLKPQTVVFK